MQTIDEWAKVVTHPLGLAGFALFLVFILIKNTAVRRQRGIRHVFVLMAAVALLGGIGLAYWQSKEPKPFNSSPQTQSNETKANPALTTKQKPEAKQTAEKAHSKSSDGSTRELSPSNLAPPIVVAPGGVVSVGQQGGITAGQVTVTNPPAKKLSLSDEQQKLVSSLLNGFDGQSVLIEVKNLTGETHAFGKALQAALIAANITADLDESLSRSGGCQASPGISFTAGTHRMPLANALASALLKAGVTDSPIPTCGRAGEPDEFIVMLLPQ